MLVSDTRDLLAILFGIAHSGLYPIHALVGATFFLGLVLLPASAVSLLLAAAGQQPTIDETQMPSDGSRNMSQRQPEREKNAAWLPRDQLHLIQLSSKMRQASAGGKIDAKSLASLLARA